MWYYVVHLNVCIYVSDNVEDVNHFLARKGYTVIDVKQVRDNETYVEVAKW